MSSYFALKAGAKVRKIIYLTVTLSLIIFNLWKNKLFCKKYPNLFCYPNKNVYF